MCLLVSNLLLSKMNPNLRICLSQCASKTLRFHSKTIIYNTREEPPYQAILFNSCGEVTKNGYGRSANEALIVRLRSSYIKHNLKFLIIQNSVFRPGILLFSRYVINFNSYIERTLIDMPLKLKF